MVQQFLNNKSIAPYNYKATAAFPTVAVLLVTSVAVVWHIWKSHKKDSSKNSQPRHRIRSSGDDKNNNDEETRIERLNDVEQAFLRNYSAPIITITWLDCQEDTAEAIISCLKSRVQAIVKANPWICGTFVVQPPESNGGGKYYAMQYSTNQHIQESHVINHLLLLPSQTSLCIDTPVDQIHTICLNEGLVLEFEKDLQQPFWRVAMVRQKQQQPEAHKPGTKEQYHQPLALVVSLSHIAGDGHTYYELYNMLMGGQPIRSLLVTRLNTTTQLTQQVMGMPEAELTRTGGFVLSMIRGKLLSYASSWLGGTTARYKVTSRIFLVDPQKIQQLKQKKVGEAAAPAASSDSDSFVSTNDLIASWFFNNAYPCAKNGLMVLNLRGRLNGHTKDHAGNYQNALYYRLPNDTARPAWIRASVSCLHRRHHHLPIPPTHQLALETFAMCTNWSSFSCPTSHLSGDGRPPLVVVHLPVYDMGKDLPPTLLYCLIFQARPGQLAVLLGGATENLKKLSKAPFESDRPFSSLLTSLQT